MTSGEGAPTIFERVSLSSFLRRLSLLAAAALLAACGEDATESPIPTSPIPSVSALPQNAGAVNMRVLGRLDLGTITAVAGATCDPGHCEREAPGAMRGSGNWGYTAPDGRRFALTGTSAGLSIDDVTSPTQPRHVALISGPDSDWREVKTYGDMAYVTTEANHGLDIIDLKNPDRPVKLSTYNETFTSAHTLCIDETRGLLFANGTRNAGRASTGMRILSLETPARPREVGSFGGFYIHDCVVRGTTLYASAIYEGFLAVLDVADPRNVREVARWNTGRRFTHNSWPTADGRFLFTTDEIAGAPLEGWDITDPSRPAKVSEYLGKAGTTPHNVFVFGTRLLVAHYTDGVHLLDVADPTRPRLLGKYDTLPSDVPGVIFDGAWGAYMFPGTNIIVVSDMSGGLFVIEYTGG